MRGLCPQLAQMIGQQLQQAAVGRMLSIFELGFGERGQKLEQRTMLRRQYWYFNKRAV